MAPGTKTQEEEGHQRWHYAGQLLIGYTVALQTLDGRWHEGIVESITSDGSVAMRWVKPLIDPQATVEERAAQQVKKPIPRTTFAASDVRQLFCKTVRMSLGDVGPRTVDDVGTDAAIGRGKGGMVGRQLERWEGPTEGGLEDGMGLEDDGGRWDQFEANKRLFNVTSTFSEDLYSTKYDPKTSSITPAQAARIAAEIEREARSTSNPHLREERGLVVDDSQVDEEDKYSAVVRHPAGGEAGSSAGGGAKRAGAAAGSWRQVVGGPPKTTTSNPIAIMDPRAETNKVRAALAAPRGAKGSSPYGTPKDNALSTSPLIGDAKGMAALNLDPGRGANVEPHLKKMYYDWKHQHKIPEGGGALPSADGGAPGAATQQPPRTGAAGGGAVPASTNGAAAAGGAAAAVPVPTATPIVRAPDAPAAAAPAPAAGGGGTSTTPTTTAAGGGTSSVPTPTTAAGVEATKKASNSKLNPNAKPFSFNPNASSFVPGKLASTSSTASSVATPPERTTSASSNMAAGQPNRSSRSNSRNHPPTMDAMGGPGMAAAYPMPGAWPMTAGPVPAGAAPYYPGGAAAAAPYRGGLPFGSPTMQFAAPGRPMMAPGGMVYMQPGMMVGSPGMRGGMVPMMMPGGGVVMVPQEGPEGGSGPHGGYPGGQ